LGEEEHDRHHDPQRDGGAGADRGEQVVPGLADDDLRKLQSALQELTECRKLIDGVMTRPD